MSAAAMMAMTAHAHAAPQSTERPLRRKDRLLTEEEAIFVVKHTPHAVLGTVDASGTPYAVPITTVYSDDDKAIYFHTAAVETGRRYQNLMQNPKVSLCFVGRADVASDELPDEFSVNYASAIVAGRAVLIKDEAEKKRIALMIAGRHVPQAGREAMEKYYAAGNKGIIVWKIEIDSISGKARNKQGYFNKVKSGDRGY